MLRAPAAAALLLGTALAGCISAGQDLDASEVPDLERISQELYDRLFKEPLEVLAPDGKRLDAFTYRPETPEGVELPTILVLSPYFANEDSPSRTDNQDEMPPGSTNFQLLDYFVPRGYAVVMSSVRGTGYSEGCFTIGGPGESKDSVAVVEAIVEQAWSNGHVGVYGVSYVGTTANDVLTEGHPAVKTIVPISAISDFYKYNFVNGVPINPQGYAFNLYYEEGVAIMPPYGQPDARTAHLAAEEVRCDHTEVQRGGLESALTGDKSAYWRVRDFNREVDKAVAPVFLVHGLQDWNVKPDHLDPWLDLLQDRVPVKAWLGQWAHNRPNRNTHEADWTRGDWNETLLRWFDHWLKGIDTGILREPMVDVQDDLGTWRHEDRWPPVRAQPRAFYLDASGLAPQPGAGASMWVDTGAPLPSPPRPGIPHYAWFLSEPLDEDLRISGVGHLQLSLQHSAPRGNLVATLWRVAPDGSAERINYGAYNYQHRDGLEQGKPVDPGRPFQLDVPLFPQDDLLPAGHRLGLTLAGNDAPICMFAFVAFECVTGNDPGPLLQPVPSGGTSTVLHGAESVLVLPTVGSIAPFEPPQEGEDPA